MAIDSRLSFSLFLFVCLCRSFLIETNTDEDCPAALPCKCSGFNIDCSHLSLTEVPPFYKTTDKTKHYHWLINLSYNKLNVIPNRAFDNLSVYWLNAVHCGIETIADDALKGSENTLHGMLLQNNKLTELPAALMNQRKLNTLTVHHNPITSFNETILRNISESLQLFDIGSEEMTVWPSELKVLKSLQSLTIHNTPFQVFPDDAFEGLENSLSKLDFEETKMEKIPRDLKTLKLLSTIIFKDNIYLRDEDFLNDSFSGMLNLTDITINNSTLTQVPDFSGQVNLFSLSITHSNVSKWDRNNLPANPLLSAVDLDSTSFTVVPKAISSISSLASLMMRHTFIKAITDDDFAGLSWLQFLYLENCPIKNISNDAFRDNVSLRGLYLAGTNVTIFPKAVKSLVNIQGVNLWNNNMTCTCETMGWIKNWHHLYHDWSVIGKCSNINGKYLNNYISKDIPNCPNEM